MWHKPHSSHTPAIMSPQLTITLLFASATAAATAGQEGEHDAVKPQGDASSYQFCQGVNLSYFI